MLCHRMSCPQRDPGLVTSTQRIGTIQLSCLIVCPSQRLFQQTPSKRKGQPPACTQYLDQTDQTPRRVHCIGVCRVHAQRGHTTFTQITAAIPDTAAMCASLGMPIVLAHNPVNGILWSDMPIHGRDEPVRCKARSVQSK